MADSRKDLMVKISAQRATIREHVDKYKKFKKNGDHTSTAETTIKNSQAIIKNLKAKDKSIDYNWEDDCGYDGT